MAERISTRAGSRRTTPQPAPQTARVGTQSPPKQSTRTTRSQSRDISDSEDGRTGLNVRRGAKQVASDGTNRAVGQSGSKGRKGGPANRARIQRDLSVLAEDPSLVHPDLESAEDAAAGQSPTRQNYKSPGGLSAFSGTTARTSLPTQELVDLSSEDMLDTLPDLSDASEKLLNFVIPAELSEASVGTTMARLQNKDTHENKKFKRLGDTFERQRKEYGSDPYINVGETLRRLLGRKVGAIDEQTALWRPDALLQKANLAIMVSRTLSTAEQVRIDRFVEDIAGKFPQPFAQRLGHPQSLTPECTALAEATFRLALEIRTQEAIVLIARHVGRMNFDVNTALLQIFYDDTKRLKGWAVSGLRTADLSKEAEETILGRVKALREAFNLDITTSSDGESSGIESLRVNFPWTTFAQQMVAWAGQRRIEVEIQTNTYGGAQAICQRLADVVQSGRLGQSSEGDNVGNDGDGLELHLDYDTPSESRATSEQQNASNGPARSDELNLAQFSTDSNKAKSAAAYLKQRQAKRKSANAIEQKSLPQNQETASDVQVASTAGPFTQALDPQRSLNEQVIRSPAPADAPNEQVPAADQDDNQRNEDDEEGELDIDIKRNAQRSLAYRRQREAESNKENVADIPESQHTVVPQKRNINDRDPLAEWISPIDEQDYLGTNGQEIEISSDEEFQLQEKPSNAAIQRRSKPANKRPASEPARLQRRSPKKVRVRENVDAEPMGIDANVARDEQETEPPLSQAYKEYVRVNQSAKQKMAVVTKPPQRRSAWTSPETEMLYYLITEHGISWKLLKDQDLKQQHLLEARDQVALKDKARNMKMDYLKAGRVLPQNFEHISLSQLQIKRLRDGGIEYDPETGTRVDAEIID